MADEKKIMTTDAGRPVGDNQNSLTVGPRGPIAFEDFLLFEKMAHFNRERIPERVVHAKGSGAHGHFVCTSSEITKYTSAKLFNAVGKKRRRSSGFRRWAEKRVRRTPSAIRAASR
jgi:catalase